MASYHIIQAITSEGLAQGTYLAARGGVEPTTFRTEGTDHHHSTNHAHSVSKHIFPSVALTREFYCSSNPGPSLCLCQSPTVSRNFIWIHPLSRPLGEYTSMPNPVTTLHSHYRYSPCSRFPSFTVVPLVRCRCTTA